MKHTLRVQRAIKEITQDELAKAVGVSRSTINNIETKRYTPSIILCLRIARYFGRPVDELFILEEEDLQ